MKSYAMLPQGYAPYASIDLVHNKKQFWIVNGLSVVLCVIMWVLPALWGYSLLVLTGRSRCLHTSSVSALQLWGCLPTSPCTN